MGQAYSRPRKGRKTNQKPGGTPARNELNGSTIGPLPHQSACAAQYIVDSRGGELIGRATFGPGSSGRPVGDGLSDGCIPRGRQQDHLGLIGMKCGGDGARHQANHGDSPGSQFQAKSLGQLCDRGLG